MVRALRTNALVLLGYTTVSFVLFGWRLVPHPGRVVLGFGHDPEIYIWSFAWWPHALGTLTNPFVSHAINAPSGINLAWTASTPGLALLFSPLTVLVGPVASYNVAMLLIPAFSAWTAYLLCRSLTGSLWASLVGGYLFGFSTAVLRQELFGHMHMTSLFLLPLIALVVTRYVRAELSARELWWRFGILIGLQLWLSTELTLTATLVLAASLGLASGLLRELRPRLVSALVPLLAGYALAAVVAAPLIVFVLLGFVGRSFLFTTLPGAGTDLLNFVIPTPVLAVGGSSFASIQSHFLPSGSSGYLGLPLLLIVIALAFNQRRAPIARLLVVSFTVALILTLGPSLVVDGRKVIDLPWWDAASHVPALNNVIPFRFSIYVTLVAAVIVARWIATTKGRFFPAPVVLPLLAVAALIPAVARASYPTFHPTHPVRYPFFTAGLYKSCIPRDATVVIFPFAGEGDAMLWQAETDFRFRMAEPGLQPSPKYGSPLTSFENDQVVWDLEFVDVGRPTMARLRAFAAAHHVARVISVPDRYPSRAQMAAFGPTQLIGGVLVSPACGTPPLTARGPVDAAIEPLVRSNRPSVGYCLGTNFNQLPQGLEPAGRLAGATPALFVAGTGITCLPPPAGYVHDGFASPDLGVPADTYPLYSPPR